MGFMTSDFEPEALRASIDDPHADTSSPTAVRLVEREPDADRTAHVYRTALRKVTEAVDDIATRKNVPVNSSVVELMARLALQSLTADTMNRLVASQPDALEQAG